MALQPVYTLSGVVCSLKNHHLWERQVTSGTLIGLVLEKDILTNTNNRVIIGFFVRTCPIIYCFKGSCLQYSITEAKASTWLQAKKHRGFYSLLSPRRKIDPFHFCICLCFYVLIGDALAHLGKIYPKENLYVYTHIYFIY